MHKICNNYMSPHACWRVIRSEFCNVFVLTNFLKYVRGDEPHTTTQLTFHLHSCYRHRFKCAHALFCFPMLIQLTLVLQLHGPENAPSSWEPGVRRRGGGCGAYIGMTSVDGYLQWAQSRSNGHATGFSGSAILQNTPVSLVQCHPFLVQSIDVLGCLAISVLAPRPLVRAFLCV